MKFKITNIETGKETIRNIDFKGMGRKSVKVRHEGKSKEEIQTMYSKIRKSPRQLAKKRKQ